MVHILDMMNPQGMFLDGLRQREYSTKDMLPTSGKLIPEFDGRRNIRDMFSRKPTLAKSESAATSFEEDRRGAGATNDIIDSTTTQTPPAGSARATPAADAPATKATVPSVAGKKRPSAGTPSNASFKRSKSGVSNPAVPMSAKGQQSLKGFFKPTAAANVSPTAPSSSYHVEDESDKHAESVLEAGTEVRAGSVGPSTQSSTSPTSPLARRTPSSHGARSSQASPSKDRSAMEEDLDMVHDPIESKESWSKLFTKPVAPRCEGHDEPCKSMLTKKSGMNCGRSFWMCTRPLGPSGAKEKNTQWRCGTFIWCSDWNSTSTA